MVRLPEHLSRVPVGRQRLSREDLAFHQRDRILGAAAVVFAERGYWATTIDDIAAASKTSVGSFYSLFAGKEECFLGAYDRIVDHGRTQIAGVCAPAEGWAEEAFLGLCMLLRIFVADSVAARIVLIEVQTAGQTATSRYDALLDAARAWLGVGRNSYPRAADLPSSFERSTVAGLAFYLQRRLLSGDPNSVEVLMGEVAPLLLEPIVGAVELRRLRGLRG